MRTEACRSRLATGQVDDDRVGRVPADARLDGGTPLEHRARVLGQVRGDSGHRNRDRLAACTRTAAHLPDERHELAASVVPSERWLRRPTSVSPRSTSGVPPCIGLRFIFYDVFGLDDDDLSEYGASSTSSNPAAVGITAWWRCNSSTVSLHSSLER